MTSSYQLLLWRASTITSTISMIDVVYAWHLCPGEQNRSIPVVHECRSVTVVCGLSTAQGSGTMQHMAIGKARNTQDAWGRSRSAHQKNPSTSWTKVVAQIQSPLPYFLDCNQLLTSARQTSPLLSRSFRALRRIARKNLAFPRCYWS